MAVILTLLPETADSLFAEASRAYEDGRYADAAVTYERIRESGLASPELHFNLGNAYFRRGMVGRAILCYRRSLRLAPRGNEAMRALNLARERAGSERPEPFLAKRMLSALLGLFSSRELTYGLLLLYWTAGLAGFYHVVTQRRWARIAAVVALLSAVPVALVWWGRLAVEGRPLAVVIQTAAARSGPGDDYQLQFSAGEGTEVLVEDHEHGWYLVRVPQGYRGWVRGDSVERW